MNLKVTKDTARQLKRLIDTRPMPVNGNSGTFGVRNIIWVRITVDNMDGTYTGIITIYDKEASTWKDYETVTVIGANNGSFDIGYRYLALCHGYKFYIAIDLVGGFCQSFIDGDCNIAYTKMPPVYDTSSDCENGEASSSSDSSSMGFALETPEEYLKGTNG